MNNLDPTCWGPTLWVSLHTIAMGYPDENVTPEVRMIYKNFYENLQLILPCAHCRDNYFNNLQTLDINGFLDSRRDLAYWVYQIHNLVNDEKNVPESERPSFEEVWEKYSKYETDCNNEERSCGTNTKRKCNISIVNKETVFSCYWPLIIIIIGLLLVIVIMSLNK